MNVTMEKLICPSSSTALWLATLWHRHYLLHYLSTLPHLGMLQTMSSKLPHKCRKFGYKDEWIDLHLALSCEFDSRLFFPLYSFSHSLQLL